MHRLNNRGVNEMGKGTEARTEIVTVTCPECFEVADFAMRAVIESEAYACPDCGHSRPLNNRALNLLALVAGLQYDAGVHVRSQAADTRRGACHGA